VVIIYNEWLNIIVNLWQEYQTNIPNTPDQKWLNILRVNVMVFNATFNNCSAISWWSVLLVEKTGVPRENHRPASHWQTVSLNILTFYIIQANNVFAHPSSPPVFSGVRVTRSLVFFVMFVYRCLSFFFWPLCCLSFDLRILITLWYLQTLLRYMHLLLHYTRKTNI
jgi:hypothetical protein